MAVVASKPLRAILATAATRDQWCSLLVAAMDSSRRVSAWTSIAEFRNCALVGSLSVVSGVVTGLGVATGTTVSLAADLSVGAGTARMRVTSGTNWIEGSIGLPGSGCDFIVSTNPTARNGFALSQVSIPAPANLPISVAVVDTVSPTIAIAVSSTSMTTVSNLTVTATPSDNVAVTRVDFYRDGSLIGSRTSAPWQAVDALSYSMNGTRSYTARAYDAAGNSTLSVAHSVAVNIAAPVAPASIVIASQGRIGARTVVFAGTVTGSPTSGTLRLPAAAVAPNGAVTQSAIPIVFDTSGSFTVTATNIAYGNYDMPLLSTTGPNGAASATGVALTAYAPGTQAPGTVSNLILPDYVAPAFNTPAVAIGATVVSLTLVSTSTSAQSAIPFTFAQPFKAGDLAPSSLIVGQIAGEPDIPLQFNVLSTHFDGSIRHANISGVLPALGAGASKVMALVRATNSAASTVATASPALTTAGFSVTAKATIGGVLYTASPDAQLAAGATQVWRSGSIASEWIVESPFKNASNVAHATLTAQFSVLHFPGINVARVDIAFEDTNAFLSTTEVTYDAEIVVSGVSKYVKTGIVHHTAGRFKRSFWWGAAPQLHIKHASAYLLDTKAVANYDRSIVVDEALLASFGALSVAVYEPMNFGRLDSFMGTTGGRPDIGLLPDFGASWVLSMDKRAKDCMLAHADTVAGAWGTHRRDRSAGAGTGRPMSIVYYPRSTILGSTSDATNTATGQIEKLTSSSYGADSAHQPNLAYLPYLLTGDFYYLEEMHFWSNWNLYQFNPSTGYRGGYMGYFTGDQVRGQGWIMRSLSETAAFTPDTHPDKKNFLYWMRTNLAFYNANYTDNPSANSLGVVTTGNFGTFTLDGVANTAMSFYMDDHFTSGVGHASELGFTEATRLLTWKAKFQIGRMTAPGFCYINAATYWNKYRLSATSPIFATLSEMWQNTFPAAYTGNSCASQAGLDYLNANRTLPSDPFLMGEITGNSGSTTGFVSNLQVPLAMAVDTGYGDSALAWSMFNSRANQPPYAQGPQFAVIPRTI